MASKPTGRPNGRPTKYEGQKTIDRVKRFVELGATDVEIAQNLDVDEDTIYEWKNKHPEFSEALSKAKTIADSEVENALLKSAKGFSRKIQKFDQDGNLVDTLEELPPNPTSMIFWLKNRQRDRWRDKQDVEHSGVIETVNVNIIKKPV